MGKANQVNKETVLVLRTCGADMTSYGGFKWPTSGYAAAPDWNPEHICGNGLHGLLFGVGDGSLLDWSLDAKWLVCEVDPATVVDLDGKVKFPRCNVLYSGSRPEATRIISERHPGKAVVGGTATAGYGGTATAGYRGTATAGYGGTATAGDEGTATAGASGTATAGYRGTATAGYGGTATAGDEGTATAGYRGTATAGYGGTATAGDEGTATAGYSGVVAIQYWNGERYKCKIALVKDEYEEGELEPNQPYRLNDKGQFEKVKN